jgi:hypothetical protein
VDLHAQFNKFVLEFFGVFGFILRQWSILSVKNILVLNIDSKP